MSELVWSYSMLDMFEECPLKWYDKYILKNKEPSSLALEYGNFVHGAIEDYLMGRKSSVPVELSHNLPMINSIKAMWPGAIKARAELKMGVNKALAPTEFFGQGVWGRGAADVALIMGDSAFIGDWKTGKKNDKEEQLKILAMFLMKHYPQVQTVQACNLWLKNNTMGEVFTFHKANETAMWVALVQRLQKMYAAVGTPAAVETRPGFLCNFCPVKSCKFNKS